MTTSTADLVAEIKGIGQTLPPALLRRLGLQDLQDTIMVLTWMFTGLAADPLAERSAVGTQDFPALAPLATMTGGIQAGILLGTTVIITTMASLEDSVTTGLLEPHVPPTARTATLSTADGTVGAGMSDPERGRVTTGPLSGCPTNRCGRPSM